MPSLLPLNDAVLADVAPLAGVAPEVVSDFCHVVLTALAPSPASHSRQPSSSASPSGAASGSPAAPSGDSAESMMGAGQAAIDAALHSLVARSKLTPDAVAGACDALTYIFSEAAKVGISGADMALSLTETSLPESHRKLVAEAFAANKPAFDALLTAKESSQLPQYTSVDWRLDVVVASRHVYDTATPEYLLQVNTLAPAGAPTAFQCQATYADLSRVSDALEAAAAELKTAHAKRVQRYL